MKKALSILLTLVMLAAVSAPALTAFAASDTVKFAVGTDIHIENTRTELEVNYPESELYFHASGSGNLYDQAGALTRDFLYASAKEGAEFILITGDLTRHGSEEQHEYVAALLRSFEKKTGIPVYVIPGNHDYYAGLSRDDFRRIYADFGYSQALCQDGATASYTADLNKKYRLIAVDSNDPGEDGDGVTSALLKWIKAQCAQAKADGKEIIYMMHHPLLEHLYMGKVLMKDFMLRNSKAVAEMFTRWGIEYVFTGHEHGNDVESYAGANGKVVYDVLTTALSSYPLEYRLVKMNSEGADLKMRKIEKCDTGALIDGYTSAQKAALRSDYEKFAYEYFRYSVEKKILRILAPSFIKKELKLGEDTPAFMIDTLFTAISDALTMPLYDSGNGVSIEKLAASKGVKIPASQYGSLIELASAMVAMHYYGDENMPADSSPECEILVKGLNTGLEYVLTRCGRGSLNLLLGILGASLGTDELSPLFTAHLLGKENTYIVAEQVLYPLLNKFAVNYGLKDRDVFLAA